MCSWHSALVMVCPKAKTYPLIITTLGSKSKSDYCLRTDGFPRAVCLTLNSGTKRETHTHTHTVPLQISTVDSSSVMPSQGWDYLGNCSGAL